jgi:hypothetical protein
MSVGCVLPVREHKYCGRWYVRFQSVCAGYGVFHSSMHVYSYSGFTMLAPCHAKVALLPLDEKTIFRVVVVVVE